MENAIWGEVGGDGKPSGDGVENSQHMIVLKSKPVKNYLVVLGLRGPEKCKRRKKEELAPGNGRVARGWSGRRESNK